MFKIEDIKPGYLLKISGYKGMEHCLVIPYTCYEIGYVGEKYFGSLSDFNEKLERIDSVGEVKIDAIYGLEETPWYINTLLTPARRTELLWERKEPKEMTVAEIEKALGYPVKIVKD